MKLLEMIYEAGIVGCGGAGFPTHIKLSGNIEHLIVNGAECEPLLRTDRYIMVNHSTELIDALEVMKKQLRIKSVSIALKNTYKREIQSLEKAIANEKSTVKILKLDNYYPAGDEQMIVYEATGRTIPPAGIPLDVGAAVSNAATVFEIYNAINGGKFTHKYLTVTGEVKEPVVIKVPIGTSFEECINLAGGTKLKEYVVVSGGPMMGKYIDMEEAKKAVVTKTTSGILILPMDIDTYNKQEISIQHIVNRARSSCIQCSNCTQMCPRYLIGHPLQPHLIMKALAYGGSIESILDNENVKQALICSQCGVCENIACPMGLQPKRVNAMIKKAYLEKKIRYSKGEGVYRAREPREYRKLASKLVASRIGVKKYYDFVIDKLVEFTPNTVEIPLNQHIGMKASPVVSVGDIVACGQLIGTCPMDKVGANIHASIDGRIANVGDSIVIVKQ